MNKTELTNEVAKRLGITQPQSKEYFDTVIETIQDTLVSGDNVGITNFGTFELRMRKAREGQNPKTLEKISIPETRGVGFKVSGALRDIVRL